MPEATPTPQAPAAAEPVATPPTATAAEATPKTEAPKPGDPGDAFKSEESKNAVLADLKKEREARQALEAKVTLFESSTAERNKALAEALGLTEAPKTEDDLAATVKSLQENFEASQREAAKLRIAAEKGVPPEHLHRLTETDPEKLTAQAEMVAEYARLKAAADGTPQFQANPGQGQGGQGTKTEDDATYEALFGAKS